MNPSFNSFGSNGPIGASVPVSSGADDIVLAPEKKSSKRKLITLVVVLTVVVVAIAFFVLRNSGSASFSNDAKLIFNSYINYLLYGDDSNTMVEGEYDNDRGEELFIMLEAAPDQAKSYADNLSVLWDDFVSKTNDFSFGDGISRDDYGKRVKFIASYLTNKSKVNEEDIIKLAQNNAKKTLVDYFGLYQQYDFGEAREYVENGQLYFNGVIETMNAIKNSGCNYEEENGGNEVECSEEEIFADNVEYDNLSNYYSNMNKSINSIADYLVINGWKINAQLNGGLE